MFQPLRTMLKPDGRARVDGADAVLPGRRRLRPQGDLVTPGNPAAGLDSHQGVVLLSSEQTGQPLAVLNASAVTEIRTAAVSAVATELLAAPGADVLAIVGTGVQARSHLMAIAATSPLAEVRIAGSRPARAAAFAADVAPAALAEVGADVACAVTACDSAKEAVDGAGIVVTATTLAGARAGAGLAGAWHARQRGRRLPAARQGTRHPDGR